MAPWSCRCNRGRPMTPLQLFRETTTRARSWPPYAWAIVGAAAASMFIAVVLLAWQGSRMLRAANPDAHRARNVPTHFVPASEMRKELEQTCQQAATWRATQTGIYTPDFPGAWR